MSTSDVSAQALSSPSTPSKVSNTKKPDNLTEAKLGIHSTISSLDDAQKTKFVSLKKVEAAIQDLDETELSNTEWKNTLATLKSLQYEHVYIEEAYRKEWSEMKLKYLEKFKPLYHRRWIALTGKSENQESTQIEVTPQNQLSSGTIKLPKFWLKAMKNHPLLDEMIEENDLPILEYLEDIRFKWVDPKDQASFQLDFMFSENPYFKNVVLSKTYYLEPSDENDEESILTRTVGTDIQWNKGKNVTEKTLVRKQRNKRTNATRVVNDVIKVNSFFNFFKTYEIPTEDQLNDLTEEDVSELEMILEAEFELGAVLRDKIIPRALGWYLGVEHDDLQSEEANTDDFEEEPEASDESSDEKE